MTDRQRRKPGGIDPIAGRSVRLGLKNRGMTLVELLLAMAMLSVLAAGATFVLTAASRGSTARQDLGRFLAQDQTLDARLSASIRSSSQILALGSDYVVLWKGDSRIDSQPNISELQRIEWTSDGRLTSYQAPAVWTAGDDLDTAYDPTSDFDAVTDQLKTGSHFPAERWANNVTAIQWIIRGSNYSTSTILGYRLTLRSPSDNAVTDVWESAVALRQVAIGSSSN